MSLLHDECMNITETCAAGSSRFSDGVPGHLHYSLPSYCALLFFMTIVAPWEQANNAAMFADVRSCIPAPPSNAQCATMSMSRATLCVLHCPERGSWPITSNL